MAIRKGDSQNFKVLMKAMKNGDVCLMDARRKSDKAQVALICAVGWQDGQATFTPFAVMVEDNPFELFDPPMAETSGYEGDAINDKGSIIVTGDK